MLPVFNNRGSSDDLFIFSSVDEFWSWINAVPKKVNVSHSFVVKNRCRSCGKFPTKYYNVSLPPYTPDHRVKLNSFNWIKLLYSKSFSFDLFLLFDPTEATNANFFSHRVSEYSGYNPRLHRTYDAPNIAEYITCECSNTIWAYNDLGAHSPEKINRQAKYGYPNKFRY